jgi:hypothetical protein
MHASRPTPPPKPPEKQFAILKLDGTEVATRETYWKALIHAYSIMRMGTFTVEPVIRKA